MATVRAEAERLAASLGEHPQDLDVLEQFIAWIQDAVDEIYLEDWDFNRASNIVSANPQEQEIEPGVDVERVTSIVRSDTKEHLKFVTVEWLITSRLDPELPGHTSHWYYATGTDGHRSVGLWPVPNTTTQFEVRHLAFAPFFGVDDTIPLHVALLPAMRELVKAFYYGDDPQRQDQYTTRLARFDQLLQKGKAVINSQATPRPGTRWTDLQGARIEPNFVIPENIPIPGS